LVDVNVKINVGDDTEGRVRPGYPPIPDPVGGVPSFSIKFYNLGTRKDGDDWEDLDDIFETPVKTLGSLSYTFNEGRANGISRYGFEFRPYTHNYTFISNTYEIDESVIENEFGPNNDDRWERRPIQLPYYLRARNFVKSDSDYEGSRYKWYGEFREPTTIQREHEEGPYFLYNLFEKDEYLEEDNLNHNSYYTYMGNGCHDFRCELIRNDSSKFDISRNLYVMKNNDDKNEMTGRGKVKNGTEGDDGEINALEYVWKDAKPGKFGIRVREVGNASVVHYVRMDDDEDAAWRIYEDITQQGIFFYGFDTLNEDQFKVTRQPTYSSDSVDGKIIDTIGGARVEAYMMPRRIAYYARESGHEVAPPQTWHNIGEYTIQTDNVIGEELSPDEFDNPCLHSIASQNTFDNVEDGYRYPSEYRDVRIGYTEEGNYECDGFYGSGGCYCVSHQNPIFNCGCSYARTDCDGPLESDGTTWTVVGWAVGDAPSWCNEVCGANVTGNTSSTALDFLAAHPDISSLSGAKMTETYPVEQKKTTWEIDHYIGLWYGQMPNKAYVYTSGATNEPTDLQDNDNLGSPEWVSQNETFELRWGAPFYPSTWDFLSIGLQDLAPYEVFTTQAMDDIADYFSLKVQCLDGEAGPMEDPTNVSGSGDRLGDVTPHILHFHNPKEYQLQNFLEESGADQEDIDDVVNPVRTFHFFTCDNEYAVHNTNTRGFYYRSDGCPLGFDWCAYVEGIPRPRATWYSGENFISRYHIPTYFYGDGGEWVPWEEGDSRYPDKDGFDQAIFYKIANSAVWSEYFDYAFGWEGRTYLSKPYGMGIVPAKEGTLAGIVRVNGKIYYIWFNNDEDYKIWGRTKKLYNPEDRVNEEDYESQDEFSLVPEYEGYQIGFEESFSDSFFFTENYSEFWFDTHDADENLYSAIVEYQGSGSETGQPTGFYNQCAGTGTRVVDALGRIPEIEWSEETSEDWIDYHDIESGAMVDYSPCALPWDNKSSANNYKRGTMLAENFGQFELDAPVVVLGSRDFGYRDHGKNNRVAWAPAMARENR
jgi:hypothetical protein